MQVCVLQGGAATQHAMQGHALPLCRLVMRNLSQPWIPPMQWHLRGISGGQKRRVSIG